MGRYFDPLYQSACLLVSEVAEPEKWRALEDARLILEDTASPITRKHQEKLFQAVIDKGHIKFDGIEKSRGNIADYEGYGSMMETLDVIDALADEQRASNVKTYTQIVKSAIGYIRGLSATYQRGFAAQCDYVMLEYNSYVYTCVEATTTLISEFVDYVKRPDKAVMTITLRNTMRANLFYFNQLQKFNKVQESMGIDYRKMLEAMISKGRNNFLGMDTMIGLGAISLVAMAIVPITREIVYQIYNLRKNASQSLELQATFLEMNKISVENNENLSPENRTKVVQKQAHLAQRLRNLSNKLRVDTVTATRKASKDLESDNKNMTLDKTRSDVENSPITLF